MSQDVRHQSDRLGLLGRLTSLVSTHPRKTLFLTAIITLICVVVTLTGLEFKSDRSDLISPDASFHKRWLEYCERFHETNELLILLEGESAGELVRSREWLIREMQNRSELFGDVLSQSQLIAQSDQDFLLSQAVDPRNLQADLQLALAVQDSKGRASALFTLIGVAQQELQTSQQTANSKLPITNRIVHALEESLQAIDTSYEKFFPENSPRPGPLWNQYLSGKKKQPAKSIQNLESVAGKPEVSKKHALPELHREMISVVPLTGSNSGPGKYHQSLQELNRLIQASRQRFPEVYHGITGIPQIEHEEMARSQSDMVIASVVSFGGVVILLLYGFHGLKLPIACCITLGVSMLWTLGLTTVLIGHLNILSMAFAAILVGLGIDFGIHLLTSYLDFRQQNESVIRSVSRASDTVGKGIVTAAVTTSIAFLCAGVTDFPGVAELGIIAGCGVLLCAMATFLVFPALIALMDRQKSPGQNQLTSRRASSKDFISCNALRKTVSHRPLLTAIVFLVPVLTLCSQAWKIDNSRIASQVVYDANLLHMQPEGLPAVETQQKLLSGNGSSVLYAVTWYPSQEEAIEQAQRFRNLPSVSRVMELASREVTGRESPEQLEGLLSLSKQISSPPTHLLPHNPAQIGQAMEAVLEKLGKDQSVFAVQVRLQLDHFLEIYSRQPFEVQIQILDSVEQELLRSLWSEIHIQTAELSKFLEQQKEFGQALKSLFINSQGDWLLQIHPREDIWSDEPLEEFVTQLRTVDPLVTGTPLQNFEASRQLKQSYTNAAIYAALAIVLVLLLDVTKLKTILIAWLVPIPLLVAGLALGSSQGLTDLQDLPVLDLLAAYVSCVTLFSLLIERRECVIGLLAILPPAMGACMLLGVMAIFEIPFTPANLIALPLVMGIGIDDGVHVVHDFKRSLSRYQMSASTWRALVLTSLTSMIGFGSLAIASHKGLAGLGTVVMIGIGSCLFVSVILLPAILSLFSQPDTHSRIC
ncbi:MAG: MMPL family transporter [Planctomycetaceae bacterium]|nr:MMPL family transporter [Planctomycetaceae bacterium]